MVDVDVVVDVAVDVVVAVLLLAVAVLLLAVAVAAVLLVLGHNTLHIISQIRKKFRELVTVMMSIAVNCALGQKL